MKTSTLILAALVTASAAANATERENAMIRHAQGPFDVKVAPVAQDSHPDGITLGRYSLDKQYHGALEAAAKGEMLAAGSSVKGSGGYVAVERVEGTLDGKRGSFALQHLGQMSQADGQHLTILVVPGSGTGELEGIAGTLDIKIAADGAHSYDLAYTLPGR